MRAELPYRPRRPFSALTRRILFLNACALFILMGGVLWVQSNRAGLIEERISGIRDQALIVAGALAEYTAVQDRLAIDTAQAEPLLRQLDCAHAFARAHLFDHRPAANRYALSARAQYRDDAGAAAARIGRSCDGIFRARLRNGETAL